LTRKKKKKPNTGFKRNKKKEMKKVGEKKKCGESKDRRIRRKSEKRNIKVVAKKNNALPRESGELQSVKKCALR